MARLTKAERRTLIRFSLVNKTDFQVYLHELITRTDKCLLSEKKYLNELSEVIKSIKMQNVDIESNEIIVEYSVYQLYYHLLQGLHTYLFNVIGDNTGTAMSYKKYRDLVEKKKKNKALSFEIYDLTDEQRSTLKLFNTLRNWSSHVPESLLTAERKID